MGTKNEPGRFDCFDKAEADEPLFVLRAKDPVAAATVRVWILLRRVARLNKLGEAERLEEAENCAHAMDLWRGTRS